MDLTRPDTLENRCLEIVTDGLPLFQQAQVAVDTTLVSAPEPDAFLSTEPSPRRGCTECCLPREGEGFSKVHRSDGLHTAVTPQAVGEGQGQARSSAFARECAPGVARQVGVSLSWQCGQSFCLSMLERRSGLMVTLRSSLR